MAIYHLHAGFVSRSTGRSAVQAAAYISGVSLLETRRNLIANYNNRSSDIEFSITLAPPSAPEFAKDLNVWDILENHEDTYAAQRYKTEETLLKYKNSARIAQTIVIALPKELEPSVWKEIVIDFAKERFVSRGLVVSMAIHHDEGNPHAHFQISRRAINENGEWSKAKDREITTRSSLIETRKICAKIINKYLEREGLEAKVDHRSFIDLGVPFEASRHEGWYARRLEYTGKNSRIVQENLEIKSDNKLLASLQPETILQEIISKQATFSSSDLAKVVQNRLSDDLKLASCIYDACLKKAVFVGSDLEGNARYSSSNYMELENKALELMSGLAKQNGLVINQDLKDKILAQDKYIRLNDEQKNAINLLTSNRQLSMIIGRAGTGKTTTLEAVVEIHKQANYKVLGLALSANAAENLQLEAGCDAETIAFYCDKWQRLDAANNAYWTMHPSIEHPRLEAQLNYLKPYALTAEHLVIVDEAGMVGTREWQTLLHYVTESGAKLIKSGDDHQFKAIGAGDFFRQSKEALSQHGNLCQLETVFRQKEAWMVAASSDLAELKTYQALAAYENHGLIKELPSSISGLPVIAKYYLDQMLAAPAKTGLLLAYTRAECDELNKQVRMLLKERGLIGQTDVNFGERNFSERDQIVFLKNDRENKIITFYENKPVDFLIKNGTRGQILNITEIPPTEDSKTKAYEVTVKVNDLHAKFNTLEYDHITHGYASTLHKAQGKTVDWSIILSSRYMDAFGVYVALSRHRDTATLYYAKDTFANFTDLQKSLARVSNKDLALDYTISPQNYDFWENVQEYKLLGQDLISTIQSNNWESYHDLKSEQTTIGKIILANWGEHQLFARQAGFTSESIAINCGLKARPLPLAELAARDTVKLYSDKAIDARNLWESIKQTHPGSKCYDHPSYQEFNNLRLERNKLAENIINNKTLYKEWLAKSNIYGWKALEAQAKQGSQVGSATSTFSNEKIYVKQIEPSQVKAELQGNIASIASALVGEPTNKNAREWRYGQKGSISISVTGVKQGLYANFEAGSYGGPLKLIQDQLNLDYKEAYKWALNWLGYSNKIQKTSAIEKTTEKIKENIVWTPVFPVPKEHHDPKLTDHNLSYQLIKNNRHETARFAYKDLDGNLLGYTVRLENQSGDKVILPLTYCQNSYGKREWRWRGFGDNRSLYGLDQLSQAPSKPILIVEGEKTADAAQKILPEFNVVSWAGGAAAVNKVDFSPIIDQKITLWPDHDEAGIKAMQQISEQLTNLGVPVKNIYQIQLPSNTPAKWDLADRVPDNWGISIKDLMAAPNNELPKTLEKTNILDQSSIREKNRSIEQKMNGKHSIIQFQIVDREETVQGILGVSRKLLDGRRMHEIVEENSNLIKLVAYNINIDLNLDFGTKVIINADDQGIVTSFGYQDQELIIVKQPISRTPLIKHEDPSMLRGNNRTIEEWLNDRFPNEQFQIVDTKELIIGIVGPSRTLLDGREMHEIWPENSTTVKLIQHNSELDAKLPYGSKAVINTNQQGLAESFELYSNIKVQDLTKLKNYIIQNNANNISHSNTAIENALNKISEKRFQIVDHEESIVGKMGLSRVLSDGRKMHEIHINSNIVKLVEYNVAANKELRFGSKVSIQTNEHGSISDFDEYSNIERQNSKEFINTVIEKYDLIYWAKELNPKSLENIKETYQQMIGWNKFVNNKINSQDKNHLLEKAIITEVLAKHAEKICIGETLFNKHIHAKQLSLIGAKIIQENFISGQSQIFSKILEQSDKDYNKQEQQKSIDLLELARAYPNSSNSQRMALVNEKYLCINMINKDLSIKTQESIMETIKSTERLKSYGEITLQTHQAVQQDKLTNPETHKTVNRMLEFKFMEQVRQRTNIDRNKQNLEKMLIEARNAALQLHNEMVKQHLLEMQRQKDREIER